MRPELSFQVLEFRFGLNAFYLFILKPLFDICIQNLTSSVKGLDENENQGENDTGNNKIIQIHRVFNKVVDYHNTRIYK